MKRKLMLCTMLLTGTFLAGCAGFEVRTPAYLSFSGQKRSLGEAVAALRSGDEPEARRQLESIIDGAPVDGVTDEALFRLALLNIKDDSGKSSYRSLALLDQLNGTWPDSLWARQAAALRLHLTEIKSLRYRQRELKNQNLSLSRDNRELRQSLERLKQLDLELEQKITK